MLFDWATQPFYTLVVTFLFAPYFVNGFMADPAHGSALWAYATGIAELIAAALAPVLGAIADASQNRKPWIAFFSVLLVVGLFGLWLAAPGRTDLAPVVLIAFGLAIIGAELATVFTNAMMVSLVSGKRLGTLSGFGWATGYVGGLISLALVAGFLVADPNTGKTLLGLPPIVPLDPATREGDRLVGPFSAVWYLVFVLPLFLFTPDRATKPVKTRAVKAGLTQLVALGQGSRAPPRPSRAVSARAHALRRRPRRGVRLWRHLCRDGVRLGRGGAWAVRHHPHHCRDVRRCARRTARRPRRLETGDRRHAASVHRRLDRRALRRPRPRAVRAAGRAEASGQRAVLVPSESRSISPSPF